MKELDNRLHYAQKAFAEETKLPPAAFDNPRWTYFPPATLNPPQQKNKTPNQSNNTIIVIIVASIIISALGFYSLLKGPISLLVYFLLLGVLGFLAFIIFVVASAANAQYTSSTNQKKYKAFAQNNKAYILTANYLCAFLPNVFDAELELELCIPTSEITAVKAHPKTLAIYTDQIQPLEIKLPKDQILSLKSHILALPHDIIDGDK